MFLRLLDRVQAASRWFVCPYARAEGRLTCLPELKAKILRTIAPTQPITTPPNPPNPPNPPADNNGPEGDTVEDNNRRRSSRTLTNPPSGTTDKDSDNSKAESSKGLESRRPSALTQNDGGSSVRPSTCRPDTPRPDPGDTIRRPDGSRLYIGSHELQDLPSRPHPDSTRTGGFPTPPTSGPHTQGSRLSPIDAGKPLCPTESEKSAKSAHFPDDPVSGTKTRTPTPASQRKKRPSEKMAEIAPGVPGSSLTQAGPSTSTTTDETESDDLSTQAEGDAFKKAVAETQTNTQGMVWPPLPSLTSQANQFQKRRRALLSKTQKRTIPHCPAPRKNICLRRLESLRQRRIWRLRSSGRISEGRISGGRVFL
jgi:hypothetical protein